MWNSGAIEDWIPFPISTTLLLLGWAPAWPSRRKCPPQPCRCCRAGGGHQYLAAPIVHPVSYLGVTVLAPISLLCAVWLGILIISSRQRKTINSKTFEKESGGAVLSQFWQKRFQGGKCRSDRWRSSQCPGGTAWQRVYKPHQPKGISLLFFVKQCDQTSFFHLLLPPPSWFKPTHFFWSLLPRL